MLTLIFVAVGRRGDFGVLVRLPKALGHLLSTIRLRVPGYSSRVAPSTRVVLRLSPENLPNSIAIMREKVRRKRYPGDIHLVPGTLHFVANTIDLFHQVGSVRHVGHFVCEEGTRLKLFTISHYYLPSPPRHGF